TYEGVASGFTVRPLCHSGHSPNANSVSARLMEKACADVNLQTGGFSIHSRISLEKMLQSALTSRVGGFTDIL
ncbi:MAG: hypothetical protein ACRCWF_01585, partial [Beijerinckiaceae bacterium]